MLMLFLKIRLKYFPRFAGKYDLNKILRARGVSVGEGTIFYDPNSMSIDCQRPWMLSIGSYCKITKGTTILTHDYSRSVLRRVYGSVIGEARLTSIGDNTFIGMHSIILMGAQIGKNVIIGAGSVVSGVIPDNCVAAGNPCRVIYTLDDYYMKRIKASETEAMLYFNSFCNTYKREPSVAEMGPFFPIFLQRSREALRENGVNVNLNGDNAVEVIHDFLQSEGKYSDYATFKIAARKYKQKNQ